MMGHAPHEPHNHHLTTTVRLFVYALSQIMRHEVFLFLLGLCQLSPLRIFSPLVRLSGYFLISFIILTIIALDQFVLALPPW